MKASFVFVLVAFATLFAVSGIKLQREAPATTGMAKTLLQKLDGVQSVELRFDERLSGYAVGLLTRQEARDRAARTAEQPENADRRQQEARRIAEQFYGANLGVTPPAVEDKNARPANEQPHRCYDIAEIGVDYVSLTAIAPDEPSMILPLSRIAYIAGSDRTTD